jgi:two-component system response regulator
MKQATILVIEDNPDHVLLIEAVFSTGLSYAQVEVAFSGEEARAYLLEEAAPALITLDLSLPDTDGLEILEWLSADERFSEIPVIIFTSSSNPDHAKRAYALGARRYMEKPPDFGHLVDAMKDELGRWIEPESGSAYG